MAGLIDAASEKLQRAVRLATLTVASTGALPSSLFAQKSEALTLPDRGAVVSSTIDAPNSEAQIRTVSSQLDSMLKGLLVKAKEMGLEVRVSHPPGLGQGEWKEPLVVLGQIHAQFDNPLEERYVEYAQHLVELSEAWLSGGMKSICFEGAPYNPTLTTKQFLDSTRQPEGNEVLSILLKKVTAVDDIAIHGAEDPKAYVQLGQAYNELKLLTPVGQPLYSSISRLDDISQIKAQFSADGDLIQINLRSSSGKELHLTSTDYETLRDFSERYSAIINSDCDSLVSIHSSQKREDFLVHGIKGPALVVFGAHHASNILPKTVSLETPRDMLRYQLERSIIVVLPPADLIDLSTITITNDRVEKYIGAVETDLLHNKAQLAREYLKKAIEESEAPREEYFNANSSYSRFSYIANSKVLPELREDLESAFKNANPTVMTLVTPQLVKCYQARKEMAPKWVQEYLNSKFLNASGDKERAQIRRVAKKLTVVGIEVPVSQ